MYSNIRDNKPVQQRKIRPTRRSVSGVYAFRGETGIEFESTLERDFIILNEFNLNVLDIIPQPAQIPFTDANGRQYSYTPDFLVYYHLGNRSYQNYPKPCLVEVKPAKEWRENWRKWLPKWKAACRYARHNGWEFHIHDESRIRQLRLENIRWLSRYKAMFFQNEEINMVMDIVGQAGTVTVDYLLSRCFAGLYEATGQSLIWHLLSTRKLDCDISQTLNRSTVIWIPHHE
ncbi:TPA: heteromeric transposase endonuclease subunit TnsA [Enterobacter hormaechei subsp. xiangfangensis]|nr:heteromeric transposase endonuclease subunit TnsA [Enterobacter hormaechei subsp. xiangfangensis]